jgi:hypothetical protein
MSRSYNTPLPSLTLLNTLNANNVGANRATFTSLQAQNSLVTGSLRVGATAAGSVNVGTALSTLGSRVTALETTTTTPPPPAVAINPETTSGPVVIHGGPSSNTLGVSSTLRLTPTKMTVQGRMQSDQCLVKGQLSLSPESVPLSFLSTSAFSLSTAQKRFGASSLLSPGTEGAYVLTAPMREFWYSPAWTIEFFFYPTANASGVSYPILSTDIARSLSLRLADGALSLWYPGEGLSTSFAGHAVSGSVSLNDWNHVAVQYDGFGYSVFLNGARGFHGQRRGFLGDPSNNQGVALALGAQSTTENTWEGFFPGYIDELRLSITDRYQTETYTVPSAAFTADSQTFYLHHFDEGAVHDSESGTYDFSGGGAYFPPQSLAGGFRSNLVLGTTIECVNLQSHSTIFAKNISSSGAHIGSNGITVPSGKALRVGSSSMVTETCVFPEAGQSIRLGHANTQTSGSIESLYGPFVRSSSQWTTAAASSLTLSVSDLFATNAENCSGILTVHLKSTSTVPAAIAGVVQYAIVKVSGNALSATPLSSAIVTGTTAASTALTDLAVVTEGVETTEVMFQFASAVHFAWTLIGAF